MLVYEAGWPSALGGPGEGQDRVGDGGRRPGGSPSRGVWEVLQDEAESALHNRVAR